MEKKISIWFSQLACTGRCTRQAVGQVRPMRSTACGPWWEEPLSTIQNTPGRTRVGLGAHHLLDQLGEGDDAGARRGAADDVGALGVVGGQIGQGAAAAVFELGAPDAPGRRWQVPVAPGQRLQLGLLIGAEHVLVLTQGLAGPDPGVEVEHPGSLDGEARIAGEDPRVVPPRADRVGGQPATHRRGRHGGDQAAGDRLGGQLGGAPAGQRHAGLRRQRASQRLDLGLGGGREDPPPAWSGPVGQPGPTLGAVSGPPLAHRVGADAQPAGDRRVRLSLGGGQHDPRRIRCTCAWCSAPASAGPTWPTCGCATGPVSPTSMASCPTASSSRCAGCATPVTPPPGASPSTGPATTTTRTTTCPAAHPPAPPRRPSTAPAASTSTTPPPGCQTPDVSTESSTRADKVGLIESGSWSCASSASRARWSRAFW